MERWTGEQVVLVLVVLGQIDEIVAIGCLVKFSFYIVVIIIIILVEPGLGCFASKKCERRGMKNRAKL